MRCVDLGAGRAPLEVCRLNPVRLNSSLGETPWFDDQAIVPAFGGPTALREAVPRAVVPMCGTGWVASQRQRGGVIEASRSGGEIVTRWDAMGQEQGQSLTCTVSVPIALEATASDSLSKPWRRLPTSFTRRKATCGGVAFIHSVRARTELTELTRSHKVE